MIAMLSSLESQGHPSLALGHVTWRLKIADLEPPKNRASFSSITVLLWFPDTSYYVHNIHMGMALIAPSEHFLLR